MGRNVATLASHPRRVNAVAHRHSGDVSEDRPPGTTVLETVKKTFGVIHLALATMFGVHFVVAPLYDSVTSWDPVSVWLVLDWLVAVGVITGVVFSYMRWMSARHADFGERLGSGAMMIGAVAVLLMFFEQWFTTRLFPLDNDAWVEDRINLWWQVVTVAFVVVSGQIGVYLLGIGPSWFRKVD